MFAVGWSHLCAALLIISGGAKLFDPAPTRGALRAARLPSASWAVIALGTTEIAVGSIAIVFGGLVGGVLLAATYAGFAVFVVWALTNDVPIQSCGCFGRDDTPPSWLHVAVNATAALGGVTIAVTGRGDLISTLSDTPLGGVPYVGFVALGVYALYLMLAELPRTLGSATA